jgi:outer membrane protein assembly factor BamC
MQKAEVLAVLVLGAVLLAACGSAPDLDEYLPDQRLQYKKQREASENLEVPPDLTSGTFDDAMDVPALGGTGTATYSQYVGERSKRSQIAGSGDVLPEVKDAKLRREGNNRWLEITGSPQQIWPKVVGFWRSQGILLVEKDPITGIMKTDWLENRAEIRKDFVTNIIRKVADGLYATSTRDQYRVRIEPGLNAGTTDLYLTHRAMEEQFRSNAAGEDTSTIWEPAPPDPAKEAAMLRRLLVYLGISQKQASGLAAQQQQAAATRSRLSQGSGGETVLLVNEDFRSAWRLVGVALDRVGFAVEDRDRTQGIYYVRYDDPSKGEKKEGWGSKLAFWRSDDVNTVDQYQVKLTGEGDKTRVVVRDRVGRYDSSATSERILTLLNEQIR